MARLPRPCVYRPPISHAWPSGAGAFPRGRDCCQIDGRTVVPAHGSREMPVWGERFGEMGGVARSARRWSAALSWSLSNTSKPSSGNATRAGQGWSSKGERKIDGTALASSMQQRRRALRPDGPRPFQAHGPAV